MLPVQLLALKEASVVCARVCVSARMCMCTFYKWLWGPYHNRSLFCALLTKVLQAGL